MRALIFNALAEPNPDQKCALVHALGQRFVETPCAITNTPAFCPPQNVAIPGRPTAPILVSSRELAHRGLGSLEGRIALAHAICHIEFNAINLALDAAWRFTDLPIDFYSDWISVAVDEARHFVMMRARLRELGSDYGQLPAHNSLWEAAEKTNHNVMARMACVPRVLEARGLDVTPGIIKRLRGMKDDKTADVMQVILDEEVRHVTIGSRWFHYCCKLENLEPISTFKQLLEENHILLRPPFNIPARLLAGFSAEEFEPIST